MFRRLLLLFGALMLVAAAPREDEGPGVPVTLRILDAEGAPIATAVVRHPEEKARHRVNAETGEWSDRILYMEDGSELPFEKGTILVFEVSAPGYRNARIQFVVKKRKNVFVVTLEKLDIVVDPDEEEDPFIQFGRDKPVDGAPVN